MEAVDKQATTDESAYATPDRDNNTDPAPTKQMKKGEDEEQPNTVTPLEASADIGKQVRFDKQEEKSKRGLVSRRGGRMGSPAALRATTLTNDGGPVLEFKTYRSPQRKRDAVENDTIPSLCSTNSELLASKDAGHTDAEKQKGSAGKDGGDKRTDRPSSISCDPSMIATTSPLASQDVDASPSGQVTKTSVSTPPKAANPTDGKEGGRRNVTFSPPTPHSEVIRTEPVSDFSLPALLSLCSLPVLTFCIFLYAVEEDANQVSTSWSVSELAIFARRGKVNAEWNILVAGASISVNFCGPIVPAVI